MLEIVILHNEKSEISGVDNVRSGDTTAVDMPDVSGYQNSHDLGCSNLHNSTFFEGMWVEADCCAICKSKGISNLYFNTALRIQPIIPQLAFNAMTL